MEIAKSVSMKVNIGDYQSLDFFCSAKEEDSVGEDHLSVGKRLHDYCVQQIVKDYNKSVKFLADKISKEAKEKLLNQEI